MPPVPPSATAPQAWPATVQLLAPPGSGWPQRPTVAPCALLQRPPQHSLFVEQTSPFCVQKEPFEQTPPLQSFEQQSACAVQALPVVRHSGLSGAHTLLALHVPLQHCAEVVQAWLSAVHCDAPQAPASQTSVQQSSGLVHALPLGRHAPPSPPPVPPAPPVPSMLASSPVPPAPP